MTMEKARISSQDTEGTEAHVRIEAWHVRTRGVATALGFALGFLESVLGCVMIGLGVLDQCNGYRFGIILGILCSGHSSLL
ncbi:hypothetical protein ES332_D13G131300v1 [Gossypium tomentosum]|uniref:Uncharacterized protein n=1 Tax=Gossypium tomentosum TaxID=34277 RepID=A0A5D2HWB8_GOSTO|nr:hypothetical protein ES332_D13G131300v1 [Gossypium tomentosum]